MLRLLVLLHAAFAVTSAIRIVGWKMDVYDKQSRTKYYDSYNFGDVGGAASGESWISWEGHFCWNAHLNDDGYCYTRIKVTTDASKQHYQIVGGFKRVMDKTSRYVDSDSTWGQTTKDNPTLAPISAGFTWSGKFNDWGYMYMKFYVLTNAEPGLTVALGAQQIKADHRSYKKPESVQGGSASGAQRQALGEYRCWTSDWGSTTMINLGLYRVPTVLKSVDVHSDQQMITQAPTANSMKTMVLINNGCGTYQEGMHGTFVDTETVTESNRATFSQTFSFDFSVSYEVGFDVGIASNTMSVSSSFGYSNSEEFSTVKTTSMQRKFTWPNYCAPGYKCIISIMKDSGEADVPVDFHFERNGEMFTERNTMHVHLENIRQERNTEKIAVNPNCELNL